MKNIELKIKNALKTCHNELMEFFVGFATEHEEQKSKLYPSFISTSAEQQFLPDTRSITEIASCYATTYLWGAAGLTWEKDKAKPADMFMGFEKSKKIYDKHLKVFQNLPEFRQMTYDHCNEIGNIDKNWHYSGSDSKFWDFSKKEGPFAANIILQLN